MKCLYIERKRERDKEIGEERDKERRKKDRGRKREIGIKREEEREWRER